MKQKSKGATLDSLNSVVDWMKSKGLDSSFNVRADLYEKLFDEKYTGNPRQNMVLLQLMKEAKPAPQDAAPNPTLPYQPIDPRRDAIESVAPETYLMGGGGLMKGIYNMVRNPYEAYQAAWQARNAVPEATGLFPSTATTISRNPLRGNFNTEGNMTLDQLYKLYGRP